MDHLVPAVAQFQPEAWRDRRRGGVRFLLALMPSSNLLWIGSLYADVFLKINNASCRPARAFKIVAPLFDPLLHPDRLRGTDHSRPERVLRRFI